MSGSKDMHIVFKRRFNLPIDVYNTSALQTCVIVSHVNTTARIFLSPSSPQCSLVDTCDEIEAPSLVPAQSKPPVSLGIESLGRHPVLAAAKMEVPLLRSSGTLPSGGRS